MWSRSSSPSPLTLTGLINRLILSPLFAFGRPSPSWRFFVLTGGLARTGVARAAGRLLLRLSGSNEARLIAVTMLGGAGFSLFMNNIARQRCFCRA